MTLAELLAAEPYASMSDAAAAAAINAATVQGRRVPFAAIVDRLGLDTTGGVTVLEAVQAAAGDAGHAYHAACLRALTVLRSAQQYELPGALLTDDSPHRAMLDAMVDESPSDAGPVPQATRDAILGMGLHSLAEQHGLGVVNERRVRAERRAM